MSQAQVDLYAAALRPQTGSGFDHNVFSGRIQSGRGFNFPVYAGRQQYGAGFGDVVRGIWRFFRPVAMSGARTLLKAGSEAIKDGATVKDVLQATLKPTLGSVLTASAEEVARRLNNRPSTAPPPVDPAMRTDNSLVGTQSSDTIQKGSGYKRSLYKSHKKKYNKKPKYSYSNY